MRKSSFKMVLRMLLCVAISFVVIYMLVFFGGWRLIESGDVILIEIAVSVIVGILLWIIVEVEKHFEGKVAALTSEVEGLKSCVEELNKKQNG